MATSSGTKSSTSTTSGAKITTTSTSTKSSGQTAADYNKAARASGRTDWNTAYAKDVLGKDYGSSGGSSSSGSQTGVQSGTGGGSSGGLIFYNANATELTKYANKLGGIKNVEAELNKRGYTLKKSGGVTSSQNSNSGVLDKTTTNSLTGKKQVGTTIASTASTALADQEKAKADKLKNNSRIQSLDASGKLSTAISKYGLDKVKASLAKSGYTLPQEIENKYKEGGVKTGNYVTKGGLSKSDSPVYQDEINKALDKQAQGIKQSMQNIAEEKGEVITDTANKEAELVNKANEEKSKRILERESLLGDIMNTYKGKLSENEELIKSSLERTKATESRAANAAVALAGQGPGVSDAARMQIEQDALSKFGANMTQAEQAAAQNLQSIAEQERNAGVTQLTEQGNIDLLINNMTDDQYKVFIKSVQDIGLAKTLALDEYKTLINELNKIQILETQGRALEDVRTFQNYNEFAKKKDDAAKLGFIMNKIYDIPGRNYVTSEEIKNIMNKYGNDYYSIVSDIGSLAQNRLDARNLLPGTTIQDASILQKPVKDLTEAQIIEMQNIIKKLTSM